MNKENLNEKIAAMEKELAAMKLEESQLKGKWEGRTWLLSLLPTLTGKLESGNITWSNSDNEWMFEQNYEKRLLSYSYYRVYLILKDKYELDDNIIESIIADVAGGALKCRGLTPNCYTSFQDNILLRKLKEGNN